MLRRLVLNKADTAVRISGKVGKSGAAKVQFRIPGCDVITFRSTPIDLAAIASFFWVLAKDQKKLNSAMRRT